MRRAPRPTFRTRAAPNVAIVRSLVVKESLNHKFTTVTSGSAKPGPALLVCWGRLGNLTAIYDGLACSHASTSATIAMRHSNVCMGAISVDQVFRAIDAVVHSAAPQRQSSREFVDDEQDLNRLQQYNVPNQRHLGFESLRHGPRQSSSMGLVLPLCRGFS